MEFLENQIDQISTNHESGQDARRSGMRSVRLHPDRSEVQFRKLLEKLPAGAYTCDAEGLITYFNAHSVELWGRAPKLNDPADRYCGSFKLFSTDGLPISHDACWMALAIKHNRKFNRQQIIVERPDGRKLSVLAHANPIHDESGKLVGAVNVLVDITERQEAEEALRRLNQTLEEKVEERTASLMEANARLEEEIAERIRTEENLRAHATRLEQSNRDLESFAYVASHDLQEPLRKIQAFTSRLIDRFSDSLEEEGRSYLNRLQSSAHRMQALIQDLLAFSRVVMPEHPLEKVSLNRVASAVVSDLEALLERSGGRVEIEDLPEIKVDPNQMRQLFQNLIANALKFRRDDERPVVKISAEVIQEEGKGAACRLVFADNGVGFDEKYLDRIFDPFQRLHSGEKFEGTGMGLAICRRIAERHGGTLTAKSAPGEGSTFIATLPADP